MTDHVNALRFVSVFIDDPKHNQAIKDAAAALATTTAETEHLRAEVERLREALRSAKSAAYYIAIGDGYFDPYDNNVEAVVAVVDKALAQKGGDA